MEYRYITEEVVRSGGRNITSPEMFEEARQYNIEAVKNQTKHHNTHAIFNIWIIVQVIFIFFRIMSGLTHTTAEQFETGEYTPDWLIWLGIIGLVAYFALLAWFAYIKNNRNRFIMALIAMPLAALSILLIVVPVGNFLISWYYESVEYQLSKELGYPSFPRLHLTTFSSDADDYSTLTYDSIRQKVNRDHPNDGDFL